MLQLGLQVYLVALDSSSASTSLILALSFSAINIIRTALQAFYSCMAETENQTAPSNPSSASKHAASVV